jgi:hypothetical protein
VDRSRLGSNQLPPVIKLGSAIVTNEAEAWLTDSVSDQALTRREAEVARLVSQGLANKVVAGQLGLCEGTVKIHLHLSKTPRLKSSWAHTERDRKSPLELAGGNYSVWSPNADPLRCRVESNKPTVTFSAPLAAGGHNSSLRAYCGLDRFFGM